jgi:hypothetical protein
MNCLLATCWMLDQTWPSVLRSGITVLFWVSTDWIRKECHSSYFWNYHVRFGSALTPTEHGIVASNQALNQTAAGEIRHPPIHLLSVPPKKWYLILV